MGYEWNSMVIEGEVVKCGLIPRRSPPSPNPKPTPWCWPAWGWWALPRVGVWP